MWPFVSDPWRGKFQFVLLVTGAALHEEGAFTKKWVKVFHLFYSYVREDTDFFKKCTCMLFSKCPTLTKSYWGSIQEAFQTLCNEMENKLKINSKKIRRTYMFFKRINPWDSFPKNLPGTEKISKHTCPTFHLQSGPLVKNLCGVGCILRFTFNLQFQQVAASGQAWLITTNTKPVQP